MAFKETTPKRVQRSYTISDKLDAVKKLKELSGNLSAASRELGIDRKPLREWCTKESELTNMPDKKGRRQLGGGRRPKHRDLETELLKWVVDQRANKMIVNCRRLREQALVLAKESGIDATDFKCSDKWIFNFVKRNKLSVRKVTHAGQADNKTAGEKAQIAQDYLDAIPRLTADIDANQLQHGGNTSVCEHAQFIYHRFCWKQNC